MPDQTEKRYLPHDEGVKRSPEHRFWLHERARFVMQTGRVTSQCGTLRREEAMR